MAKNRYFNFNGELLECLSDSSLNREYRILKVRPALKRANNLPDLMPYNVIVWELTTGERDRGVVVGKDGGLILVRDFTGLEHTIPISDVKEVWEDGSKLWSSDDYVSAHDDLGFLSFKSKIKH